MEVFLNKNISLSAENILAENQRLLAENEKLKFVKKEKNFQPAFLFRQIFGVLFIIFGLLLTPFAIVGYQVKNNIIDTSGFVNNVAPIIENPAVQSFIVDATMDAIDDNVDFDEIVGSLIDSMKNLGLNDTASSALSLLQGGAVQGIQNLIRSNVANIVGSDFFEQLFRQSLETLHSQSVILLSGNQSGAIVVGNEGSLGFDIGFVVVALKERLQAQGMDLVRFIPDFSTTIVVLEESNIRDLQTAYKTINVVSDVLPWVAFSLLVIGMLCLKRRAYGFVGLGVALTIMMSVLLAGISFVREVFMSSLNLDIPPNVVLAVYDILAIPTTHVLQILLTLGILFAVVGLLFSSLSFAVSARQIVGQLLVKGRYGLSKLGFSLGNVGEQFYQFRKIFYTVTVLVGVLLLLFVRPLSVSFIIALVFWVAFFWVVFALLQKVPGEKQYSKEKVVEPKFFETAEIAEAEVVGDSVVEMVDEELVAKTEVIAEKTGEEENK